MHCVILDRTNIVDGIIIKRASNNSVIVTWILVETSSADSRGSPLYIVTYIPLDGGHTGSMNTTSNSVTLTGLDSGVSYVISVQVTFGKVMNEEDIPPGMYRDDVIFIIARLSAHCCNGRDIFI